MEVSAAGASLDAAAQASTPEPDAPHDALYRADVLREAFSRLPCLEDLAAACMVNRTWLAAGRDDLLWRSAYVRHFGEPNAWEACMSFREQCARRMGLRRPTHVPPLPGPPAPGAQLEAYDKQYGICTFAVSYDPATRALLRAVRSPALVGDVHRVAVQAIPLEPQPAPPLSTEVGGGGGGQGATGGGARQREAKNAGPMTAEGAGVRDSSPSSSAAAAAASGPATSIWPGPGPGDGCGVWVCMLSADGRAPPSLYPPPGPDGEARAADGELLTDAGLRQIASLTELLPTVMCCGGGLLYLPAGPLGRGLAVWDLTAAVAVATATPASAGAPSAPLPFATPPPTTVPSMAPSRPPQQPYWLVLEAHPGRLLAAAADGCLAVSGCDGGRLRFWGGRQRAELGEADITELTRLPVVEEFPNSPANPGAGRHRLRIALCEASGLAVVALASPLAPKVYIYRAAPRRHDGAGGGGGGADGGGVGQLLATQTINGPSCSALLLFRRRLLTMPGSEAAAAAPCR